MIDKVNKKYSIEFINKYLLIKIKANDNKERILIKLKNSFLYFLYLTEKGIASFGTILPLKFKYINAKSLFYLTNFVIPSNYSFLVLT